MTHFPQNKVKFYHSTYLASQVNTPHFPSNSIVKEIVNRLSRPPLLSSNPLNGNTLY